MRLLNKTGTALWQRVLRGVLVVGLVTGGSVVVGAGAAHAAIGACNNYSTTSACINFGHNGQSARVDFYQNRPPSQAYYWYKAYIIIDGSVIFLREGLLDHTGHYCCYTWPTDSYPNRLYRVRSRIDVYSGQNGQLSGLHIRSESPLIEYYN